MFMKIINFNQSNSLFNQFLSEIRDVHVQGDRIRFRRNIERVGEIMAYEISRTLPYHPVSIQTPLATAVENVPSEQPVVATILRAGLPLHQGFINYFDHAENAFVSAYRKYINEDNFDIHIEYIASPRLDGKILILTDPMLATGSSMELAYEALLTNTHCFSHCQPSGHRAYQKSVPCRKNYRVVRCHRPGTECSFLYRAGARGCRRFVLWRKRIKKKKGARRKNHWLLFFLSCQIYLISHVSFVSSNSANV